jgi:siroheme synthase
VVFYMAVAQLPAIVQRLRGAGASEAHPVALIERATLPQQRVLRGRLADIVRLASQAGIGPPALLVTGEAAAFAAAEELTQLASAPGAAADAPA